MRADDGIGLQGIQFGEILFVVEMIEHSHESGFALPRGGSFRPFIEVSPEFGRAAYDGVVTLAVESPEKRKSKIENILVADRNRHGERIRRGRQRLPGAHM